MRLALVTMLTVGCASLPKGRLEALRARPAYTTFDPTGVWIANGGFLGNRVRNERLTVSHDGVAYKIERELDQGGVFARVQGMGLVEGDRLFVAYGPLAFPMSLEVYELGAQPLEGFWVNGHLRTGVVEMQPEGAMAGRLASQYRLVGGNDDLFYKQKVRVRDFGPAQWMKWWNGGVTVVGVAQIAGDRLVCAGMEIQARDPLYGVTNEASGYFEVAVYHFDNGMLVGAGAFGNSELAADGRRAPLLTEERWVRGQ